MWIVKETRQHLSQDSPYAATILNAEPPKYRGAYVELMKQQWTDWSQLTRTVRSERPVDHDEPEAPGYPRQFTWAMHHRSVDVAARVARQMKLNLVETLLDLGGGPGTYAMAFLARHPKLKATICDRPAALEVAKEIAARHKARKRLSYLPLNFMDEPLSGHYDVVWYSNVLHIYSPEENQALFRHVLPARFSRWADCHSGCISSRSRALQSRGRESFCREHVALYRAGRHLSLRDTARWLKAAGYVKIRPIKTKQGTEDWDGGLLEAARPVRR